MRLRPFVALLALALLTLSPLRAQPTSAPSPAADEPALALARRIADAPDDAARHRLIDEAPAELREGSRLRTAFGAVESQLSLGGDYPKCEALSLWWIELSRRQKDAPGVASAQLSLANALREMGRAREAEQLALEAVACFEREGDEAMLARALRAQAIIQLTLAQFQSAQRTLLRALALGEKLGDKAQQIPVLNTLGNVYRQQGRPERALETFARARALVADDSAWNMAFIFNNMGQCEVVLGRPERAAEYVRKALAVAERVKFRPRVASANIFLGEISLAQGKTEEAAKFFATALELSRELRVALSEARAQEGLARVELRGGRAERALAYAAPAVAIHRNFGDRDLLAPALTLEGRCLRQLGRTQEARQRFEEAIRTVEAVRTQLAGSELDAQSFLERQVAPYQELIALLVEAGQPAEALERAEQAKARVLRDLLRRSRPDLAKFLTPAEQARAAEAARRMAQANRALGAELRRDPRDPAALARAEAALRQARAAVEETEDAARQAHPEARYAGGFTFVERFAPAQLSRLAASGTVWVEYVVTETQTFVFFPGTEGSLEARRIEVTRAELADRVERFRSTLARRNLAWKAEAKELWALLLGPAESALERGRQVEIVPDGALWELPFAALVDARDRTLLERWPLRFMPSLDLSVGNYSEAALPLTVYPARGQKRRADDLENCSVVLVGNPSFGRLSEFAALPETEGQLEAIGAAYAGVTSCRLTGSRARAASCLKAMRGARVLHFGTHGLLNNSEAMASSLVLAQTDLQEGEDGFLEARTILNQPLVAELVFLQACETGRGRAGAGEGLLGLSWAFLGAGCYHTVVSQWKVESASAGQIAVGLHQRFAKGQKPAEALRATALEIAQKKATAHPFFWAPFVVIGR